MSRVCQTDGSCRGGFDFTLAFEDGMLGLLPQLAPVRLVTQEGGNIGSPRTLVLDFSKSYRPRIPIL